MINSECISLNYENYYFSNIKYLNLAFIKLRIITKYRAQEQIIYVRGIIVRSFLI